MKLNRKRSLVWDHFMKIFHVDDLDKPEAERRIDAVRCQLCQLPNKMEYNGYLQYLSNKDGFLI